MRTTITVRQIFRNIKNQMFLFENKYADLFLETNKDYVMEIREIRNKRTLQQNKYLWALIKEIASNEETSETEIEVYIKALEEANAKYIYLLGIKEVEDELKKNFRAVKVVRPTIENGKEFIVYKCFVGSSKMNTQEMTKLLNIVLTWADELGIDTHEEHFTN